MIYLVFLLELHCVPTCVIWFQAACLYASVYLPLCLPITMHGIKLFVELKVKFHIFQICEKCCYPQKWIQNIHRNSHSPFTSVLWSVLHWNEPELSMKSKHGQQYQRATVWTKWDRAAKPPSQLGAQINRQDRRSVCDYSSLWLCLSGTKALFKRVRIVDDCMRSIINEDILTGSSIMMYTPSPQPCLRHPCGWIFKSTYCITHSSPFWNAIPPLQRKRPLIYEMPMLLCQSVKVQVLQEAALQDVTRCHAYILSHCNISLAEVNELDTGWPQLCSTDRVTLHASLFSLCMSSTHSLTSLWLKKTAISLSTCSQGKVIRQRSGHLCFSRLFSKVIHSAMSCIYLDCQSEPLRD